MLADFTWMDGVGVVGSLLICSAYLAVSNRWVDPEGIRYHLINIAGAGLLLASLYFRPNPGAILIEAIWVVIAMLGIVRALRRGRLR